ncbi:MAG: sulfatase-like hydrolase/transferase, partial [Planctomycetes bacterium]|nr:sulfatase-like hydrolase/transferase [Planctomycetota bacterium]
DENTLILFTGDNGALTTKPSKGGPSSAFPLRAGKGWGYEGGIRVPFIVRAPGVAAGSTCDIPVVNTDFYATILDLCGLPLKPEQHKDSVSLRSLITGEQHELQRAEPLVWHYPHYHGSGWVPGSAIRVGDWKLVESYHDEIFELYNIAEDIGEKKNLADSNSEKAKSLRGQMQSYLAKVGAPMASRNEAYDESMKSESPKKKKRKRKKKK